MKMVFTGHRPNKLNHDYSFIEKDYAPLTRAIVAEVEKLLPFYKPERGIIGMAQGFDIVMANLFIKMDIPFTAAIPCSDQDKLWSLESREHYHMLLHHPLCTRHYVYDGPYKAYCMNNRNKWMIDRMHDDDILVSCHDGSTGGTADCLKYAGRRRPKILNININPYDLRETIKNLKL